MRLSVRLFIGLVLGVTAINFAVTVFLNWIGRTFAFPTGGRILLLLVASFLAAVAVVGLLIVISPTIREIFWGFRRILRLENLSHPLLLRLAKTAPGTYHHSLQVAILAARAARSCGADSLLARIGGYYHDIGKMENPDYFIENQKNGKNPHDTIADPRQSAQIIIDHINIGLKLAAENNLPPQVIDFIPQHVGTTLVSFFYEKARNQNPKLDPRDFRYPGPKPLSRETAIVMLADSIEAMARLLPEKTTPELTRVTDQVIDLKNQEHQLDLSGLSDADLRRIRHSFIETLEEIYHSRIPYPGAAATGQTPISQTKIKQKFKLKRS